MRFRAMSAHRSSADKASWKGSSTIRADHTAAGPALSVTTMRSIIAMKWRLLRYPRRIAAPAGGLIYRDPSMSRTGTFL